MKGPTKREEAAKLQKHEFEAKTKPKRGGSASIKAIPITFDEAKACCKARKRKERQESISSLCQERKVIRSNSEERPAQKKHVDNTKSNMRRVSSSEDFQKSGSVDRTNLFSHIQAAEKTSSYEECEYEKRRSHERFCKPLTLKNRRNLSSKRYKMRYSSRTKHKSESEVKESKKTEKDEKLEEGEERVAKFLQLHCKETDRSPSPINTPVSPVLDLTTLHEQVDSAEPLLSEHRIPDATDTLPSISLLSNRLLSSPRNSIIATHRIYLDPDVQQMNTLETKPKNCLDERLQRITKQMNSLKKKIKKQETEFEGKNGYKPSHSDKLNDKVLKKLYADLSKLRKEHRQLADISGNCSLIEGETGRAVGEEETKNIKDTLAEIERRLVIKRETVSRSYNMEDMTATELVEEKVAMQKALLYLESIHGRPNNKEDRDLVRPLYDRYRLLKRMITKITVASVSGIELATIHEDETMNFITPIPSQSSNDTESDKTRQLTSTSTDSDTDTSIGENFHALSKVQLMEQLKEVTEEKKQLKRTIKEFESDVQDKTGRMIQKEDKVPMEEVYMSYKKVKAKMRLLEALVGKKNKKGAAREEDDD